MKKQNKFDKLFLLSWKKVWIIIVSWFSAVILHNLIYGLFKSYFDSTGGGDEPFFFIVVVIIIPLYVFVCVVYSLIKIIKKLF
jgi:hypothetical protein